ncbi:hypothetical protein AwPolaro_06670 [Polaromonas sp.]|nr:hypothetical protein AwPolaro_06670 [Polaromonas sp.]
MPDPLQELPAMSLDLDLRQRAMLREMGVQVWLPETLAVLAATAPPGSVTKAPLAIEKPAPRDDAAAVLSASAPHNKPSPAAPRPPVAAAVVATQTSPSSPARPDADGLPAWRLGAAQALYTATTQAGGARWLVLAQMPIEALTDDVLTGDAGRLLDNMLRAARLPEAGAVFCAPVVRYAAIAPDATFAAALAAAVAQSQPDILLLMGRLASQALLQSTEPLGKLRGQVHALHGIKTVVTYDAPYLLRAWADKAKAWDDLCLAMSLVTPESA